MMSIIFFANVLALMLSLFVVGAILGVVFSRSLREAVITRVRKHLPLTRAICNPILAPGSEPWNAEAVLNPAALVLGGRTHLIYRAVGMDGVSRLGYASSPDGVVFDERLPYPIFAALYPGGVPESRRRYSPTLYPSGGSWGGCEDPRAVLLDGQVFVTFNMFENWALRVAFISMSEEDFLAKRFDKWEGPFIFSHGDREKNWTLFPERINGKIAVLHGIIDPDERKVSIEYTDNLETFSEQNFSTTDPQRVPDTKIAWHVHVRSAGPPPIKTDKGWLVLYHAHDAKDGSRYQLGAMLLDLADPTRVTARAVAPVLSPDAHYENEGKPGIVYACGAVVRDDTLFVYYGGADKVVCLASTPLAPFLDALIDGAPSRLSPSPLLTS